MTAAGTDAFLAGAGVCPAIHVRLERRRAAARALFNAAARRLGAVTDLIARVARPPARR